MNIHAQSYIVVHRAYNSLATFVCDPTGTSTHGPAHILCNQSNPRRIKRSLRPAENETLPGPRINTTERTEDHWPRIPSSTGRTLGEGSPSTQEKARQKQNILLWADATRSKARSHLRSRATRRTSAWIQPSPAEQSAETHRIARYDRTGSSSAKNTKWSRIDKRKMMRRSTTGPGSILGTQGNAHTRTRSPESSFSRDSAPFMPGCFHCTSRRVVPASPPQPQLRRTRTHARERDASPSVYVHQGEFEDGEGRPRRVESKREGTE